MTSSNADTVNIPCFIYCNSNVILRFLFMQQESNHSTVDSLVVIEE